MGTSRHWKQRWEAGAPLIFTKRLRMGDGWVVPGQPVTDELREQCRLDDHRLRNWWNGGFVARSDMDLPPHLQKAMEEWEAAQTEKTFPHVEKGKAGWYTVIMAKDADPVKVHGKKKLEEMLA